MITFCHLVSLVVHMRKYMMTMTSEIDWASIGISDLCSLVQYLVSGIPTDLAFIFQYHCVVRRS